MKFLVAFLLVFAFPAEAAKPLYATKTLQVGKRTLTVEDRGSSLLVRAPDYELSLRDTDEDKFFDEKLLRQGKLEMRFFNGKSGAFQNLEMRERRKDGVFHALFFRHKGVYKLLEAQFRPHRMQWQEISTPVRGHYYQVCRSEIQAYAAGNSTKWLEIIGSLNETEMYGYLRSLDIVDPSCNAGEFKGSYEHILRGMASVLATYKMPGEESRYLGCLEKRQLPSLANTLLENLTGKGENQVAIRCDNRRRDVEETTGSYNSRNHQITFYEPYEKKVSAEVAKKLYARTFFHEAIHSCGMEDEAHVHALESCCSDDKLDETKSHCAESDRITAREHRLVTYASSFARHLPGFEEFWRELVSFKDTQAEKDIFDHFIVGAEKVFQDEGDKLMACIGEKFEKGTTEKSEIQPCYEESYQRAFEGTSHVLDEVCELYFDGQNLPENRRKIYQARCLSFRSKLAAMLKTGYETDCFGNMEGETDRCVKVAMHEAMKAYHEAPDYTRTYEKLAMARQSDQMRYLNSLYQGLEKSAPGLEGFRLKLLRLLRDNYPKGKNELTKQEHLRRAEKSALEQQALFLYRYLGLLDKTFPRSDAGSLSFECRSKKATDSFDCEREKVERVNEIFFQYFCPTTITVSNQNQVCGELRTGIESVWDEVIDRCPHKGDPAKGYLCFQNVFAQAVDLFSDPRVREPPAFGLSFLDREKLTRTESRLMEDYELTDVERAYLGAIYRAPGGKDFFEQAVTDVDTGSARRILQFYVRFLRAKELEREQEGKGNTAERYEACLREVMTSFGKNEDCDKKFLENFRADTDGFYRKWCGVLFNTDGADSCSLMQNLTEKFVGKLTLEGCEKRAKEPSFRCINQVFQVAQSAAQNMSPNFFTWERVQPLRRSKDHMKTLIARLNETESPSIEFDGKEKAEARVHIDFSDYERMRRIALDAEERAGPLAEMGKKVIDEMAKVGIPEAHASENSESSFAEGRRVYGSEAQPWASRGGEEFLSQEEYRRHQSVEALDRDGIVREKEGAANTKLPPPLAGAAEPKQAADAASKAAPAASRANRKSAAKGKASRGAGAANSAQAGRAPASMGGGGGGGANGGGTRAPAYEPRKAKLSARKQGSKAVSSALFMGDRGPATRAKPVDAAQIHFGRPEILELAKKNPAEFLTRLDEEEFLAALKFHKILVIVNDKAYGSLNSATILRYDDGKGSFDALRLGDEE